MNRLQYFAFEVSEIVKNENRKNEPNPQRICADLCYDLYLNFSTPVEIYKGLEKKWVSDNGYTICKRNEATSVLTVGEKSEGGAFKKGSKNYWLKKI